MSNRIALASEIAAGDERLLGVLGDLLEDLGEDAGPWRRYAAGEPGLCMEVHDGAVFLVEPEPGSALLKVVAEERTAVALPAPVAGEVPIGADALRIAHALARHFGHQWGQIDPCRLPAADATASQLDALTLAVTTPDPCGWGITAPSVGAEGDVVHESATGRFVWRVAADGSEASVRVCRPAGAVVAVTFCDDGTWRVERENPDVVLHQRHVEDALGAARGLAAAFGVEPSGAEAAVEALEHAPQEYGCSPGSYSWSVATDPTDAIRSGDVPVPTWGRSGFGEAYSRDRLDWWCADADGVIARFRSEDDAARAFLLVERRGMGAIAAAVAVRGGDRDRRLGLCRQCGDVSCACR